jgi:hypothetical protein
LTTGGRSLDSGKDLVVISGGFLRKKDSTHLTNANLKLLNGAALYIRASDYALDQHKRLRLSGYELKDQERSDLTNRNSLSELEHLLGHLVLVLFSGDDQHTLKGVGLLTQSEEDNLSTLEIYQTHFCR